ncbi:MAG: 6-bladed beta-propeller, partial [Longimicrobiales bacterium]
MSMRSASRLSALPALTALLLAGPLSAQQRVVLPEKAQTLAGAPTDVFSVGKEEGESWEMLSNVQAVTFDRQNNLYVMDSGNFRVLVFDARGKFLRQVGKQGNGPGELTFPLGIALAPDGNIVVADMGRGGFTIFKPDGSYVKNVNAPEGKRPGGPGTGNLIVDASGAVIYRTALSIMAGGGGRAMPDLDNLKSPIIRAPLTEGAQPTTLYEIPLPKPRVQESGSGGRVARMV